MKTGGLTSYGTVMQKSMKFYEKLYQQAKQLKEMDMFKMYNLPKLNRRDI